MKNCSASLPGSNRPNNKSPRWPLNADSFSRKNLVLSKYQSNKSQPSRLSRCRLKEKPREKVKLMNSNIGLWMASDKSFAENAKNGSRKASSTKVPQAKTAWPDPARYVKTTQQKNAAAGGKPLRDNILWAKSHKNLCPAKYRGSLREIFQLQ